MTNSPSRFSSATPWIPSSKSFSTKNPKPSKSAENDAVHSETTATTKNIDTFKTTTTTTSSLSISVSCSQASPHLSCGTAKSMPQELQTLVLKEISSLLAARRKSSSQIHKHRRPPVRHQQVTRKKFYTSPTATTENFTFICEKSASLLSKLSKQYSLVRLCTAFLENEIRKNSESNPDLLSFKPSQPNLYGIVYSQEAVDCALEDYIRRWEVYGGCDPGSLLHAIIYVRRVQEQNEGLAIVPATVHRLFAPAAIVASKFVQDAVYPMMYYRRVSGMSNTKELSSLEVAFLQFVRYNLYVSPEELSKLVYEMDSIMGKQTG